MEAILVQQVFYSQSYINRKIIDLARRVYAYKDRIDCVVGIANGGLHISVHLAECLKKPHHSVYISCYELDKPRSQPLIEGQLLNSTRNLIVDDIIDSGNTFKVFDKHFGLVGNITATLFWRPGSFKPDFYVEEKPDAWVHFPWEAKSN